jgi:hypothetical protein
MIRDVVIVQLYDEPGRHRDELPPLMCHTSPARCVRGDAGLKWNNR